MIANTLRELETEFDKTGAKVTNMKYVLSSSIDKRVLEIKFDLPFFNPGDGKRLISSVIEGKDAIHIALFSLFETDRNYVGKIQDSLNLHYDYSIETGNLGSDVDAITGYSVLHKIIQIFRLDDQADTGRVTEDLIKISNHMIKVFKK